MRWTLSLAALTTLSLPLAAQQNDPDNKVAGGGKLPAGWSARTDKNAPMADVKFVAMGPGWHFTTGPAVIVWRAADAPTGALHTEATFTQTKAPAHAEAYGLFIAGKDLGADNFSYTYFLTRGDGKFLIKKMAGGTATNVTAGWAESDALVKQDTLGKATNKLEIAVGKDGKVSFKANGKEVHSMDAAPGAMAGIVGLRVNHNLDVHVAGFVVHKL
jgi:hypothetical protein